MPLSGWNQRLRAAVAAVAVAAAAAGTFVASAPASAHVEPGPIVEWNVGNPDHFSVAANPGRQEYLVVASRFNGTSAGVFAQRFNAAGTAVGTPITIVASSSAHKAQVAYSPNDDRYLITWEDGVAVVNTAGIDDVYAQLLDGTGSPVGAITKITAAAATFCDFLEPAVAARPGGGFYLAYVNSYATTSSGLACAPALGQQNLVVHEMTAALAVTDSVTIPAGPNGTVRVTDLEVHPDTGDLWVAAGGSPGHSALVSPELDVKREWNEWRYAAADPVTGRWIAGGAGGEAAMLAADGTELRTIGARVGTTVIAVGDGTWLTSGLFTPIRRVLADGTTGDEFFGFNRNSWTGFATLGGGAVLAGLLAPSTAPGAMLLDVEPTGATAIEPARFLDTRAGASTFDEQHQAVGSIAGGTVYELDVAGRGDVPEDATAILANVTAVGPAGPGFVTLFPCGTERPNASSLNYTAGQVVPNAVLAKLGTDGKLCVFTSATANLIVDVNGYTSASTELQPLDPSRVLETRSGPGLATVDGQQLGVGRIGAGQTLVLPIAGRGGVTGDDELVALNVTAVRPAAPGFATVFPCDADRPNSSNINYGSGEVVPNQVVAKLSAAGTICIFSSAEADYLVDVAGAGSGDGLIAITPGRLADSRPTGETIDGENQADGPFRQNGLRLYDVAGRADAPDSAETALVNVISVGSEVNGFLTVYPCTNVRPTASNVNYRAGEVASNAVFVDLNDNGALCVFSSGGGHVIIDILGYGFR